ncbi:MAG: DUF2085 domain-containing protein [Candidatus Humimicrobiaceae bacterium]
MDILSFLGGGLCHQKADRTFNIGILYMPVCGRDTGIYLGIFISLITIILLERRIKGEIPSLKIFLITMGIFLIMGLDVVLSFLGIIESSNIIRFITGFLTGWFLVLLLLPLANNAMFKKFVKKNYLDRKVKFFAWLFCGVAIATAFIFTYQYALIFWGVASILGMVTFVVLILFILFFSLNRRLRGSIDSGKKYIISLVVGIIFAIALLSLFSYLRQFLI